MHASEGNDHWEHGGLVTGLAVGLGALWTWDVVTPPTKTLVAVDMTLAAPGFGLGLALVPVALLLGGMLVGSFLWSIIVERRQPRLALRHGKGRSRSWPMLAASIAALVMGWIAAEELPTWTARLDRHTSEYLVRISPVSLAIDLTAVALTWALVYMVGRFIMGDEDGPDDVADPVAASVSAR